MCIDDIGLFNIKGKILAGYWHSRIRASLMVFRTEQHFDFIIVNTENAFCINKVIPNGRSLLKAISEIIGNSVLISSQKSFNKCFNKTQVGNTNSFYHQASTVGKNKTTQFDTRMMRNDDRELLRILTFHI